MPSSCCPEASLEMLMESKTGPHVRQHLVKFGQRAQRKSYIDFTRGVTRGCMWSCCMNKLSDFDRLLHNSLESISFVRNTL